MAAIKHEDMSCAAGRFIPYYLISGPVLTEWQEGPPDKNQLRYEKRLRSIVARRGGRPAPSGSIRLGGVSELGTPWELCRTAGGFISFPLFSPTPHRVELLASAVLEAGTELAVPAVLWTYAAVEVWLNGRLAAAVDEPVYKPIRRLELRLELKPGENLLILRMQNLAIRDTRNIMGVELQGEMGQVRFRLPDGERARPMLELDRWLWGLGLEQGRLLLPPEPPCAVWLAYEEDSVMEEAEDITGAEAVELRSDRAMAVIYGETEGGRRSRRIELLHNKRPAGVEPPGGCGGAQTRQSGGEAQRGQNGGSQTGWSGREGHIRRMFRELAAIGAEGEYRPLRFGLFYALARRIMGLPGLCDMEHLRAALGRIERREDCSDFFLAGLLRMLEFSLLPEELQPEAERVILAYRYWMTEDGADGMCFWSENHALMFYVCAYMAGKRFPDRLFLRSGRTGAEVSAVALDRVRQWLDDVEEYGFEEFLSGDYMCVTFGALLNAADFMEAPEAGRASGLLDRMLRQIALHTFRGTMVAPQGRVYRSVILPFTQAVQSLVHLANPQTPYGNSEWMAFLMNSRYRPAGELAPLMARDADLEYQAGNAWVKLLKKKDYALTSVQSPRMDPTPRFWENVLLEPGADMESNAYVKSLNESFHGTTRFEPGVYGYQQHMWSAALDAETLVFANHPGEAADDGGMRPGYWYGNGIMPAVRQEGSLLGAIYVIGERHPIGFTHLYFPQEKLERTEKQDGWLFGQKGGGYVGVWCSAPLVAHHDLLMNCEQRAASRRSAYLCQCGSEEEYGSLEVFMAYCRSLSPRFDEAELRLTAGGGFRLQYEACENRTQYI
ncbi:hypothetical protein [Paenibacillus sp. YN15]|uniref:hypothetical protein n=1 Tax=Paenibacillus sp. YN15 TaxID=1742774 RepID=UPI000DCBB832|nr:hypothetical protein [Paenibacillus sp. YN15]RAV04722.1 hypothetical protein DQG13_05850 [Paenibacillus sp. YN15]